MTREELLKNVEDGILPKGIKIEDGMVYNAHGMNVTVIGKVFGELVKEYYASVDIFKEYHKGFEKENDDLVNLFLDLGTLQGDGKKIILKTNEARSKWFLYAHSLMDLNVDVMYKLLLIYEAKRVIETLEVYLQILDSLGFEKPKKKSKKTA